MIELAATMQVLRPYDHVIGFYDGRIPGLRAHSPAPNWLDDGAFTLGCCSFAIIDSQDALVYDTHMSIPHARFVRRTLEEMGITRIIVVLSHWHTDHVAGNAVFADCPIIANRLTVRMLEQNRAALEAGDPPIKPLVMPNIVFDGEMEIRVGAIPVTLRQLDIHSLDETVLLLEPGLLLAGDTLEDTVTYVSEPERLAIHLQDLQRLSGWSFKHILPNHGSVERIAAGGYDRSLIAATQLYVEKLLRLSDEPALASLDLRRFAAEALATGGVEYFEAYEAVHRANVEAVLKAQKQRA
jgi:glyoxylase-like metal-dependent hydrolase (beta-lactamase superfamily II)